MKHHYYLTPADIIIRVRSSTKPATYNVPMASGTFKVYEYTGAAWIVPLFPEITLLKLKEMKYIGWTEVPG